AWLLLLPPRLTLEVDGHKADLVRSASPPGADPQLEGMPPGARSRDEGVEPLRDLVPVDQPPRLLLLLRTAGVGRRSVQAHRVACDERLSVPRSEDRNLHGPLGHRHADPP